MRHLLHVSRPHGRSRGACRAPSIGQPPPRHAKKRPVVVHSLPSGGAVHVEQADPRHPAVLLLHGVGGGAWSFGPQREALRASVACFTFEARGHGAARPVPDAGLNDTWVDALEALEWVFSSTGRPVVLVGHSMGGLLAMALACERPVAVAGVFLIEPVYAERGTPPAVLPRPVLAVVKAVMSVIARSFLRDGWLGRAIAWPVFRWAFHDVAAREAAWALQRTQVPLEHPRMLFEAFEGIVGFPFRPFADVLKGPVAVLEAAPRRGSRRSRFEEAWARLRARLGGSFSYDTVRGGHYLQLDRPHDVSSRLHDFIRGTAGTPANQG
jgi:pimeloyl-ACP methyl ester carboxylesterase